MDTGRFRLLLDAPGPFASVYFAESDDADEMGAQVDLNWPALRDQLKQLGADESVAAEIQHAVNDVRLPVGRGGRAVVAGATGVLLNEHFVPILEYGFEHPHYLLVVVDASGALITSHADHARRSETVKAGHGGASKARGVEAYEYGDLTMRAVADRVGELADHESHDTMFVVGDASLRRDLLAALPDRLRARAVALPLGARRGGYDFVEIQRAIDTLLVRQRLSVMDNATERFTAEIGRRSGLAAEGLDAVCSALRQGTVDTMIIGEIDDATVVADAGLTTVAPNCRALSEHDAASAKTLRADEVLPMLAISGGASLVRSDERIAPADGIAAVLRLDRGKRTADIAVAEGFEPPDGFSRLSLSRRVH
jgi:peptide chain release factor subunit 1